MKFHVDGENGEAGSINGEELSLLRQRKTILIKGNKQGSMSDKDEYDDLDDLLDEDPSKLDIPDVSTSSGNNVSGESSSRGDATIRQAKTILENVNTNDGPLNKKDEDEIKVLLNDLQDEFKNLLVDNDAEENNEAFKTFNELLTTLDEARTAKTTEPTTNSFATAATNEEETKVNAEGKGFNRVVSDTLDRLKENGSKVDSKIAEEKTSGKGNPDDVLAALLDQLVAGADDPDGDDAGEDTLTNMINQMSSKEILYESMIQTHGELTEWIKQNEKVEEHQENMDLYRKQCAKLREIMDVFEKEDYTNDLYRGQVTKLLDDLEHLGELPVSKGFKKGNNDDKDVEDMNMDDITKILGMDGTDNPELEKKLEETCNPQ